jgi:hypothetical protein
MKRRTAVWMLTLGLAWPALASAQDRFPPEAGSRVRVSAPRYFLFGEVGTVAEADRFGMQVDLEADAERVDVPYTEVSRLEVSRGETKLTLMGAAAGAALGMVLGATTTPMPHQNPDDPFGPPSGGDPFGRMMVGAMAGGVLGGLLGSAITVERWEPVLAVHPRFRR